MSKIDALLNTFDSNQVIAAVRLLPRLRMLAWDFHRVGPATFEWITENARERNDVGRWPLEYDSAGWKVDSGA